MDFKKTSTGFKLVDNDETIRLLGGRVKRFNWSEDSVDSYYSELDKNDLTKAIELMSATRE